MNVRVYTSIVWALLVMLLFTATVSGVAHTRRHHEHVPFTVALTRNVWTEIPHHAHVTHVRNHGHNFDNAGRPFYNRHAHKPEYMGQASPGYVTYSGPDRTYVVYARLEWEAAEYEDKQVPIKAQLAIYRNGVRAPGSTHTVHLPKWADDVHTAVTLNATRGDTFSTWIRNLDGNVGAVITKFEMNFE